MKNYIRHDAWKIVEEGFIPEYNRISESLFSIGNGRMGQRANFEETYTGDSLQGSYIAGIYYPDKTRVGWWKNGYPEYFAKVLNAANWIGIDIEINGNMLDLAVWKVLEFSRELNMKEGFLYRRAIVEDRNGNQVRIESKRICSLADPEIGAIRYVVTPMNFDGDLTATLYVDGDVMNEDSNYDEKFWKEVDQFAGNGVGWVVTETRKTSFCVATGMRYEVMQNGEKMELDAKPITKPKYAANKISFHVTSGIAYTIYKYAGVVSSEYHGTTNLEKVCVSTLERSVEKGFEGLLHDHSEVWRKKWEECDIIITGDVAAQQGIRYNIFQLIQTYTGEDEHLNISPKGFTGEKYGGSTYWDTEAYCLPFFLGTADENVARNLLIYRYKHLDKAIENAEKLGFKEGAALYPMVTMNGEECHNEWEITFEEIHRNGAIAYAIYDYIRYTGDAAYLETYGLEVLIAISRFWSQRVNWSDEKQQYVILGVTGPNEFENNVNNNWYTNTIAVWTLRYTMESIGRVMSGNTAVWESLSDKLDFKENEIERWKDICSKMYYPEDAEQGIFLQQDGFLDKELTPVRDLPPEEIPINQHWSWDRILRSCFIKQADVLQGLFFFEDNFDTATIKRNFDFYEPLTVHESSLSPCVHAIQASLLGYRQMAYAFYLRTARLDLDDYNNDTEDGCHITSMAGTWMAFTMGFGGMRVKNDMLHFSPFIPDQWENYEFSIRFRGTVLHIGVSKQHIVIRNTSEKDIEIMVYDKHVFVASGSKREVKAIHS